MERRNHLTFGIVVVLALVMLGVVPVWLHSMSWGFGPVGIAAALLIGMVLAIMALGCRED